MDFATMGRVGSYIKQKNLSFAANYKMRTGQRVIDIGGNLNFAESSMFDQINKASKKSADEIKSARLGSIKSKLMSGRKLSNEEMSYLRENDEELYKKAKHADDAREELKAELKAAKTKQEARQILTRAMVKASAEATAELAAYKSGISMSGAVGDVPTSTENVSMPSENIAVNETSALNENVSANIESNSVNENSEGENYTQSIMEKFTMTIRALEDEWTNFTNSDDYKNLSEDSFMPETFNRKFLKAIYNYRQTANIA